MKILHARLETSAVQKSQFPESDLKQITLLGRSNAGKSSFINTLINRRGLARTSSTPGKTRLVNFYRVDAKTQDETPLSWHMVDLPGYGYAKVSKTERAALLVMIETFLADRPEDKLCFQLLDIRHAPSQEDFAIFDIMRRAGYPLHIIAAKADKISRGKRPQHLQMLGRELGIDWRQILPFSAITREGREQVLGMIEAFCLF